MLAGLVSIASAAVLDIPGTYASLEEAVADANPGDTIEVGAVVATGLPDRIDFPLTIRGVGASLSILVHDGSRSTAMIVDDAQVTFEDLTLDGANDGRLIQAIHTSTVTLTGVDVLRGAEDEGALVWVTDQSGLVVTDGRFMGGRGAYGGAIDLDTDAWLDATDTWFEDNEVSGLYPEGGALRFVDDTTGVCTRCTFVDNHSLDHVGGAIALLDGGAGVDLVDCTFDGNTADGPGGAVHLYDGNRLSVIGGTFRDSLASAGGAIGCNGSGACDITVTGATFEANTSASVGGHVWVSAGTLAMDAVTFTGGEAPLGGGAVAVEGADSAVTITDGIFEANHSGDDGGAVHVVDAALELVRPWACDNVADADGGAVMAEGGPRALITNGTFLANDARDDGGALRFLDRSATVSHGTFLGNVAAFDGSAIAFYGTAEQVAVLGSVFSGNVGPAAVDSVSGPILVGASAFWDHPQGDFDGAVTETDRVELLADPFPGLDPTTCPAVAVPVFQGELVDAAPDLDPDGSAGDLGATGGPDADPALWEDLDDDGVAALWDCDDLDPARAPDQVEVPGNAVDEDCDGVVDDGDTGTPPGTTPPGTTTTPPGPTTRPDRPRSKTGPEVAAGCGCAGAPGTPALFVALAGLLAIRRRRARTPQKPMVDYWRCPPDTQRARLRTTSGRAGPALRR